MDANKVAQELVEVAKLLTADRWKTMPKGWTDESRKKFWDSLTGDVKHKVTKCIKRMEGNIDDPGAFCAALADRIEGTTKWRGPKESADRTAAKLLDTSKEVSHRTRPLSVVVQAYGTPMGGPDYFKVHRDIDGDTSVEVVKRGTKLFNYLVGTSRNLTELAEKYIDVIV